MNHVSNHDTLEKRVVRKLLIYVAGFMGVLYITNLLGRFNLGYASLSMNESLGFSSTQFGLAAGLFFVGYLLAELPSNVLMLRYGARLWIARIMISWGICSGLTAFVWDDTSFYAIRLLLGIAEAGFLPGAMLYLATWIPSAHRSKAVLLFFAIGQFAGLLGPAVSSWILTHPGMLGLESWQMMFLFEAVPTITLGVVVLFYLPAGPAEAKFLLPQEKQWLTERLASEKRNHPAHGLKHLKDGLLNLKVWALFGAKFANGLAVFTIGLWMPQVIKQTTDLDVAGVGLVASLPAMFTIPAMWFIGNYSDRSGNRRVHAATMLGLCALFSMLSAAIDHSGLAVVFLGAASLCAVTATGVSWAIAPSIIQGRAAATGFAVVNAGGISAGFAGGYFIGWLRDQTGSFDVGFYVVAITCVVGALCVLSLKDPVPPAPEQAQSHAATT